MSAVQPRSGSERVETGEPVEDLDTHDASVVLLDQRGSGDASVVLLDQRGSGDASAVLLDGRRSSSERSERVETTPGWSRLRRALGATTPRTRLVILVLVAILAAGAYLAVGLTGNIAFALGVRGWRVATVVIVAVAVALSTVLFHTVTQNRILTPGIMGFDSLYMFVVTLILFFLGVGGLAGMPSLARFALNIVVMVGFSLLLFRWMFTRRSTDLHLMLMVGIVLGTMLRSGAAFLQRLLAPSDFQVLQDFMFASFGRPDPAMVVVTAVLTAGCAGIALSRSRVLDVMALGRAQAISLGVDHARTTSWVVVVVTLLVASSTALVGPIVFLGLLVANLAYLVAGTHRHAYVVPVAIALSVIVLSVSQLLVERVFRFTTATGIIVEFVGGVVFLILLLRRKGVLA